MRVAPRSAPIIVPEPPKMFTPPTTTAATTASSIPWAATTVMFPNLARNNSPPRPAMAPEPVNAQNTSRWTGSPTTRAPSGLRPDRVQSPSIRHVAQQELA